MFQQRFQYKTAGPDYKVYVTMHKNINANAAETRETNIMHKQYKIRITKGHSVLVCYASFNTHSVKLSKAISWNLTTRRLAVTGGGTSGKYSRLWPAGFTGHYNIVILTS